MLIIPASPDGPSSFKSSRRASGCSAETDIGTLSTSNGLAEENEPGFGPVEAVILKGKTP